MRIYLKYLYRALGEKLVLIFGVGFVLMNIYILIWGNIQGIVSHEKTYIPVDLYRYIQLFWGIIVAITIIYLVSIDYKYRFNEVNIVTIKRFFNKFDVIKFGILTSFISVLSIVLIISLYIATKKNAMIQRVPMEVTLVESIIMCIVVIWFIMAFSIFVTVLIKEISVSIIIVLISLLIIGYKLNFNSLNEYKIYVDLYYSTSSVWFNKAIYSVVSLVILISSFFLRNIKLFNK
ncbi:MAG: hypothetical protein ACRC7N_03095 [Clostridium sp.]